MTSAPSAALANLTEVLRASLRYVGPVLEQPAWAGLWTPPWPPDDQRPLGHPRGHGYRHPRAGPWPAAGLHAPGPRPHDVAARVRWHGAGLRLGPRASAARIRAALQRVLRVLSFREAAGRLRRAIQADVALGRLQAADAGSLWPLRRLVLAEVAIAIVVLTITALLGIATPPRTPQVPTGNKYAG